MSMAVMLPVSQRSLVEELFAHCLDELMSMAVMLPISQRSLVEELNSHTACR